MSAREHTALHSNSESEAREHDVAFHFTSYPDPLARESVILVRISQSTSKSLHADEPTALSAVEINS